jgi:hypothetical protein
MPAKQSQFRQRQEWARVDKAPAPLVGPIVPNKANPRRSFKWQVSSVQRRDRRPGGDYAKQSQFAKPGRWGPGRANEANSLRRAGKTISKAGGLDDATRQGGNRAKQSQFEEESQVRSVKWEEPSTGWNKGYEDTDE